MEKTKRTKRAATIYDIAERVGVSTATVSFAFSGTRPISSGTRRQIYAIADELGYSPNYAARSLAARKSNAVGVLVNSLSNVIVGAGIDQIDRELSALGYRMFLVLTHEDAKTIEQVLKSLAHGHVDGVLNLEPKLTTAEIARRLPDMPALTMGREDKGSDVLIDRAGGVASAVNHLLELGHTRIGYISGELTDPSAQARQRGYIQAMRAAGITLSPFWMAECNWTAEHARAVAPKMLASGVTAIVTCNDMMAMGVYRACWEMGLSIPGDVSIVGYDDSILAQFIEPQLTTVNRLQEAAITHSVKALINKIEGLPQLPPLKILPKLVVRGSTAAPAKK